VGGTGLEPVTPSLSIRLNRAGLCAPVRQYLQIRRFPIAPFVASARDRTVIADIADIDLAAGWLLPWSARGSQSGTRPE